MDGGNAQALAQDLAKAAAEVRGGDKLLTSQRELLTPKQAAELSIAERVTGAAAILDLVATYHTRPKRTRTTISEGGDSETVELDIGPGEASVLKTQLTAAMYILDAARDIAPRADNGKAKRIQTTLHVDAVTQALSKKLATKQHRMRFIDAIPAQASDDAAANSGEHTSVSDTQSQSVAADGVEPAADGDDTHGG